MNKKIGIFLFFVFYFWCYALLSIVNADTKSKLTILNAGSKTGSFAMQMTAISKDLQKYYNIDLKILFKIFFIKNIIFIEDLIKLYEFFLKKIFGTF